jgi:PAS domain S-box-containing protein
MPLEAAVVAGLAALVLAITIPMLLRHAREHSSLTAAHSLLTRDLAEGHARLAASEAKLASALQAARMYGWEWDLATNQIRFTEGAQRILGVTQAGFDEVTSRIDPADRTTRQAIIDRAIKGDGAYELEFRFHAPHGTIWIASRGEVRRDAAGRPVRIEGVAFDITERKQAEIALIESEARLRRVQRLAAVGGFEFNISSGENRRSGDYMAVQGLPADPAFERHEDWVRRLHPEDRERAEAKVLHAIRDDSGVTEYAQEYRIITPAGEVRWIAARAEVERDQAGRALWMRGAHMDVTELKQAEEQCLVLLREVDHRARNALAMVQSLIRLSRADDAEDFAATVHGRVGALARAHTLLSHQRFGPVDLAQLVAEELRAETGPHRFSLDGPPVRVLAEAVQPLALVLHELASNAVRHGALSVPDGRVHVTWTMAPEPGALHLAWRESGGPALPEPPGPEGFGAKLIRSTVAGQLGGEAHLAWPAEGFRAGITIGASRLAPPPAIPTGPGG